MNLPRCVRNTFVIHGSQSSHLQSHRFSNLQEKHPFFSCVILPTHCVSDTHARFIHHLHTHAPWGQQPENACNFFPSNFQKQRLCLCCVTGVAASMMCVWCLLPSSNIDSEVNCFCAEDRTNFSFHQIWIHSGTQKGQRNSVATLVCQLLCIYRP